MSIDIETAEWRLVDRYAEACAAGDVAAVASWAPTVADWGRGREYTPGAAKPRRSQVLWEVMYESFDFTGGPEIRDLLELLLATASGDEGAKKMAQALITRMSRTWARYNAEAEE